MRKTCRRGASALVLGAVLWLIPAPVSASGDGTNVLTGVVRDARGVAQMGVLVQVLSPGVGTVGTAFTDEHGRYTIAHLLPGRYRILATATLFLPATRPALDLNNGAHAVVDLTMSALFDTASWLPADRRRADEPDDDWKWTLRSSANRPILRFTDEHEPPPSTAGNKDEVAARVPVHGTVRIGGAAGALGDQQVTEALLIERQLTRDMAASFRLTTAADAPAGGETGAVVALEKKAAYGGGVRSVVEYSSMPGLRPDDRTMGLQSLRALTAQQAALGERVEMEAGGEVQGVRAGSSLLLAAHPFLRLTVSPGSSWRVEYGMSTDRRVQEYADLQADADQSHAPRQQTWAVLDQNEAVRMESGVHQELSLAHDVASGRLEVAYFHDDLRSVMLSGVGAGASAPMAGLLTEAGGNRFAVLADGYNADGARVAYTAPLRDGMWIVAEYAVGDALSCRGSLEDTASEALGKVKARSSQAALVSLHGRTHHSGTQVRASYRWQPSDDVSPVDPYGALSEQAFLSLFARQQLRLGSWIPSGLEATVDVSNLLEQGYRPFLSSDGRTLYLAQTPRAIQVGLAFNF